MQDLLSAVDYLGVTHCFVVFVVMFLWQCFRYNSCLGLYEKVIWIFIWGQTENADARMVGDVVAWDVVTGGV